MAPKLLLLAFVVLIASTATAPTCATPYSNVKYYENGKQIPTPLNLPPVYPVKERQRRIGGTAVIAFGYDRDGKVLTASVKTSSGNKNLDAAAVTAVKKWTVAPVMKDGEPQAGESETSLSFNP